MVNLLCVGAGVLLQLCSGAIVTFLILLRMVQQLLVVASAAG